MKYKTAVVMMQKNEYVMLPIWVNYYSALFGSENLFVFDNCSDDEVCIKQLNEFSKLVSVEITNSPSDFDRKGKLLQLKANDLFDAGYDFVYFADADEFIAFNENGYPAVDRELFFNQISKLADSKSSIFRIAHGWLNIPKTTLLYTDLFGTRKVILRSDYNRKMELDVGFHLYDWGRREDIVEFGPVDNTCFGIMHFHNKLYNHYIKSSKEKLKSRVPDFNYDTLINYNGAGVHLVSNMLSDEAEYYKSFESKFSNAIDSKVIFDKFNLAVPNFT